MRHSTSRTAADRHANGMSRSVVEQVDDTTDWQNGTHSVFANEQQGTIEHAHPYGFTHVPKKPTGVGLLRQAAEAIFAYLGGNRSHGISVMVGDRRFRLKKLAEGEVALYDDQGHQVHFQRGGLYVSAPNSKKITAQIMQSDQMPTDQSDQNSQIKNGQIAQYNQPNVASYELDKNGFTLNHPKGTVTINAATVNINAPDINLKASDGVFTIGPTYLGVDSPGEKPPNKVPDVADDPSKQTYVKIA